MVTTAMRASPCALFSSVGGARECAHLPGARTTLDNVCRVLASSRKRAAYATDQGAPRCGDRQRTREFDRHETGRVLSLPAATGCPRRHQRQAPLETRTQSTNLVDQIGVEREDRSMEVTVQEAKTHLSRLLRRVEAGESVTIRRGPHRVALLVPAPETRPRSIWGDVKGHLGADFDETPADFAEYLPPGSA